MKTRLLIAKPIQKVIRILESSQSLLKHHTKSADLRKSQSTNQQRNSKSCVFCMHSVCRMCNHYEQEWWNWYLRKTCVATQCNENRSHQQANKDEPSSCSFTVVLKLHSDTGTNTLINSFSIIRVSLSEILGWWSYRQEILLPGMSHTSPTIASLSFLYAKRIS